MSLCGFDRSTGRRRRHKILIASCDVEQRPGINDAMRDFFAPPRVHIFLDGSCCQRKMRRGTIDSRNRILLESLYLERSPPDFCRACPGAPSQERLFCECVIAGDRSSLRREPSNYEKARDRDCPSRDFSMRCANPAVIFRCCPPNPAVIVCYYPSRTVSCPSPSRRSSLTSFEHIAISSCPKTAVRGA